jgi:hypothetical protein
MILFQSGGPVKTVWHPATFQDNLWHRNIFALNDVTTLDKQHSLRGIFHFQNPASSRIPKSEKR